MPMYPFLIEAVFSASPEKLTAQDIMNNIPEIPKLELDTSTLTSGR